MMNTLFPDNCRPSSLSEEGLPLASAFELRQDRDEYLSVNWVEFFNAPDLAEAIDCIRLTFREKEFRISHNDRFVSLQVGKLKDVIQLSSNLSPRVTHLPQKDDPSHCGVYGYTASDELIPAEIARLIKLEDVHLGKLP